MNALVSGTYFFALIWSRRIHADGEISRKTLSLQDKARVVEDNRRINTGEVGRFLGVIRANNENTLLPEMKYVQTLP